MSGSALRGINLVAQVVVAFFLTPFIVHSLGDHLYGFWALVGTFIGYYGLLDLGLGAAVSRYAAAAAGKGDREEYGKVFSAALQLYLLLGAGVLSVSVVVAFLTPHFAHNPQDGVLFRNVLLILGCSLALTFPVRAYSGVLNAELRLDALSAVDILTLLLRTAMVVGVLLAGYKLLAIAWVTFVSGIPQAAAYVVLSRRVCPWLRYHRQSWLGKRTKSLFSYGVFALVATMADKLRSETDVLVITGFIGLAAVTHFRIAALMIFQFVALMMALTGVVQPWFSRMDGAGDHRGMRRAFFISTKLSLCMASFVAFGFIAWGRPFIQRWMGPSYLDAYPCLVVLALGRVAGLGQHPSRLLLYATAKHKFFALINVVEGVANLGLSLWLVQRMGIFGVALGTFIPMALIKLIVQPLYVCRVSPISYGEYMRELGRSALVVGTALVIPGLISAWFAAPAYSSLILVGLLSLGFYILVISALEFNRQERETLMRALLPARKQPNYSAVLSEG